MNLTKGMIRLNIQHLIFTNNVSATTNISPITQNPPETSSFSQIQFRMENQVTDDKYRRLCFNDVLHPYGKELYNNFDFKYDNISSLIKNMLGCDIPGQNFFINYDSIRKIFYDEQKADLFLRIADYSKENVTKELAFVKETAPEKIKNFLRSYSIKISKDFPFLINYILKGDNLDVPLNEIFTSKLCTPMYYQLYFISALERISTKLISPMKFDGLNNSELNFILLKDIIGILDIFRYLKTKMSNEDLMNEFNLMLEKRFKLFADYSSVMFALHWVNYPYTWSRRMIRHFEYESRLSTLQRYFRVKAVSFVDTDWKNTKYIKSSNLVIDTLKMEDVDQHTNEKRNLLILNSIQNIEDLYFNNKIGFITANSAEILQRLDSRISFKKTYYNKNYVLNMIFFNRESKVNNDIFLYNVKSEHVLNVYKVFNNIISETNYDGKIKRLGIWTVTDEYDSRLSFDMIKNTYDIEDIATAVLSGLRDLERNRVFYSDIGINDIVVCNANKKRTYKIDLRRAFRVDDYEAKKFGTNLGYYHNNTIKSFMAFFQQMIDHLNMEPEYFKDFIDFSKKRDISGKLTDFDDLVDKLPKRPIYYFFADTNF